jgi:hypothetical protein
MYKNLFKAYIKILQIPKTQMPFFTFLMSGIRSQDQKSDVDMMAVSKKSFGLTSLHHYIKNVSKQKNSVCYMKQCNRNGETHSSSPHKRRTKTSC